MLKFITISIIILLSFHKISSQNYIIDTRDGQRYPIIKIGEDTWFGKNLNYTSEGSYCYDYDLENCKKYGHLYEWEAALKACPEGWHLSTEYEWQEDSTRDPFTQYLNQAEQILS